MAPGLPLPCPGRPCRPELIRNDITIFSELVPILAGSLRKPGGSRGRAGRSNYFFFSSKRTLKNRILKYRKKKKIKAARLAVFGCGKKVAIKQKLPGALGGEANCAAGQVGASFSPLRGCGGDGEFFPQPPLCPAVPFRVRGPRCAELPPSPCAQHRGRADGNAPELPRCAVQPGNPPPATLFLPQS